MFNMLLLLFVLCMDAEAGPLPAKETFDQRQTGDVNVQLDLRNIELYAILGDYEIYEDYEDFLETSEEETSELGNEETNTTTPTAVVQSESTLTLDVVNQTAIVSENLTASSPGSSVANISADAIQTIETRPQETSDNANTPPKDESAPSNRKRCAQGFFRDRRGRCRKGQQTIRLPFGFRIAPRLRKKE